MLASQLAILHFVIASPTLPAANAVRSDCDRCNAGPNALLVLRWRTTGSGFLDFRSLDLADATLAGSGVYVICFASNLQAVRIGQARRLRDRLRAHKTDSQIVDATGEPLCATWAWVPEPYKCGVEAYLARRLYPHVGERFPSVRLVEVNWPPQIGS